MIVISLLIILMKDQVNCPYSLRVNAILLSDISLAADLKKVESGKFYIVYRSSEYWLGDMMAKNVGKQNVQIVCSPLLM